MSTILNHTDAGFTSSGPWQLENFQGLAGSELMILPGNAGSWAQWTFSGLAAGMYQAALTWIPFTNRATAALVELYDGSTLVGSVNLNQVPAPNDFQEAGAWWEKLGAPVPISSGTLKVKLYASTSADQQTIADAASVAYTGPIDPNPPPPSDTEAIRLDCMAHLESARADWHTVVDDQIEELKTKINAQFAQ